MGQEGDAAVKLVVPRCTGEGVSPADRQATLTMYPELIPNTPCATMASPLLSCCPESLRDGAGKEIMFRGWSPEQKKNRS